MGCGCRKNRGNDSRRATTPVGTYQVWRNGTYTGRAFTSLVSAETYAASIGGEVVTV